MKPTIDRVVLIESQKITKSKAMLERIEDWVYVITKSKKDTFLQHLRENCK